MRKVSKKRAAENKLYTKVREAFLDMHIYCERCGCVLNLVVHHKAGRAGKHLTDMSNFMAVCNDCHDYIHAHPAESYERGWMLKRSVS